MGYGASRLPGTDPTSGSYIGVHDLGLVTQPLCASAFSSGTWINSIFFLVYHKLLLLLFQTQKKNSVGNW